MTTYVAAGMLGTKRREPSSGGAGVFLLDADGPNRLEPLGLRGAELSTRPFPEGPSALARELGECLRLPLEVHAVVHALDRIWIVLRRSTRYSIVGDCSE